MNINTRIHDLFTTALSALAFFSFLALVALPQMVSAEPFIEISTCAELQLMGSDPITYPMDGDYVLTGDIDCTDSASWNEGDGFEPIGNSGNRFAGTFDGNGFTITGLTINRPATDNIGLFGYTQDGVTLSQVHLQDVDITGRNSVAGLVGRMGAAEGAPSVISQVSVIGDINGLGNTGAGVAGHITDTTVSNVYMRGIIVVNGYDVGGVLGYAQNSSLEDAYFAGQVTSTNFTAYALVGWQAGATTITTSLWDFDLSGLNAAGQSTGPGGARTTEEMKTESTFTDEGWDFETIWSIAASRNDGYPYIGDPLDPIIIQNSQATNITKESATLEAEVISGEIIASGFFWGDTSVADEEIVIEDPDDVFDVMLNLYTDTNGDNGDEIVPLPFEFSIDISDLVCGTTYYARPIVFNYDDLGGESLVLTEYLLGDEFDFTTQSCESARRPSGDRVKYTCKDTAAKNYNQFGRHDASLCIYESPTTVTTPPTVATIEITEVSVADNPNQCPADLILTQNLRAPSRNGVYNSYTKDIVREINILQTHLNRLGFNSGPVDGIAGPLTDGAIKRMQTFLGTTPDGYVGPVTRSLINESCGEGGLQQD